MCRKTKFSHLLRPTLVLWGLLLFTATVSAQQPTAAKGPAPTDKSNAELRKAIKQLTSDNERLRARVSELEHKLQAVSLRDHLTQEEQRAENLQTQLITVAEKEANVQSQMDKVDEQLRPENLDNLPVYGSLRPEEARESNRRRLNNEKLRLQGQLDLISQSRIRLQSSLSVSDVLIQTLRLQLQSSLRP